MISESLEKLAAAVGAGLLAANGRLVTVESCTGGGVAWYLTSVAGSSEWFERGLVTYSNEAKSELVSVAPELIDTDGAVSKAVAESMAEGGLLHGDASYAVSVTGVAGPGGGTVDKPVGTVCFAWAWRNEDQATQVVSRREQLAGDRAAIRNQSIQITLQGLLDLLT